MTARTQIAGVRVRPVQAPLRGRAAPPGSKSITNRALLLAALARGTSRLTGALKSDDTARMAEALRAMGVAVDEPDATTFVVHASGRLEKPAGPLFLGNAGTAMRFLTAAVSLVDGTVVLDGDHYMRERPVGALAEALGMLGVSARATAGKPPVTVEGHGGFSGERVEIDASLTSQYVSALLMLAACGEKPVEVALKNVDIGARGYIDLTTAAMARFGAQVEPLENGVWRVEPTGYIACDLAIEPDASAATYLWAAEALTGGSIDQGVPADAFTQPDAAAHAVIAAFPNMPAVIDGSQMQDAVPTLAVLAAFNETPVRFTGIANLRVKECDRISALSMGLNAIRPGLAREEGDELVVQADPSLAGQTRPARIDVRGDHRIAMAFAVAGLKVGGIVIENPACTAKTWPEYWDVLADLGVELEFE
ncbi:3-phosphoshikimate 1-carboxyvinyltransferase [Phenylobacterium sp.]|uniref:3-phosphoshikimate 1-carboxyvinyltransferase n=1 Tax=Phenylobacterium sp. TaxID=1871053 RepID=UPI0035B3D336